MGFERLPPWDANKWFFVPTETTNGLLPTAVNPLCLANPMRVGLIFSAPGGNTSAVSVSINQITTIAQGIGLGVNSLPLMLTHQDWGALVQQQWFGASGGAGQKLTVTELVLRDWPEPDPHDNMDVHDYLAYIAAFIKGLRQPTANGGAASVLPRG